MHIHLVQAKVAKDAGGGERQALMQTQTQTQPEEVASKTEEGKKTKRRGCS